MGSPPKTPSTKKPRTRAGLSHRFPLAELLEVCGHRDINAVGVHFKRAILHDFFNHGPEELLTSQVRVRRQRPVNVLVGWPENDAQHIRKVDQCRASAAVLSRAWFRRAARCGRTQGLSLSPTALPHQRHPCSGLLRTRARFFPCNSWWYVELVLI